MVQGWGQASLLFCWPRCGGDQLRSEGPATEGESRCHTPVCQRHPLQGQPGLETPTLRPLVLGELAPNLVGQTGCQAQFKHFSPETVHDPRTAAFVQEGCTHSTLGPNTVAHERP